jgi:lycopene beta-cyclase
VLAVRHLTYLGVLAVCLIGTAPLEIFLHARVYRRWRRTVLAIVPAVVLFTAWDVAAIRARWWHFDQRYLSGAVLPGRLPLEELLFFVVVPLCAILTFEAVRHLRPAWLTGDEPAPREPS